MYDLDDRKCQGTALLSVVLICGFAAVSRGGEPVPDYDVAPKTPFDVRQRRPWTSDKLRGTPEPPDPYTTQDAFPRLKFFEPLSVGVIPGSGRFGVATRPGKIFTFENRRDVLKADLLMVEHPHSDFRSITGGYVYESARLPKLKGAYIYGDYDAGKVWSLRLDRGKVTDHHQLADTQIRIVEFARDEAGEVFLVDFAGGGLHRLVEAPPVAATKPFPRKLSETGLFESTKDVRPASGLIPYSVNAPLWSDGSQKERFLALPGNSQIEFDAVTYPHGPNYADRGWRFPDGTILVKTFSLEMETGNPASSKRLETRLLQHRHMPGNDDEYGAQFWFGYTYLWNNEQTDADLLPAEGLFRAYTIRDPAAPGGTRQQTWRFPSRTECTLCHTMASKYVLGVTTLQMNKDHDYGGVTQNQLAVLERLSVWRAWIKSLGEGNRTQDRGAINPRLVETE